MGTYQLWNAEGNTVGDTITTGNMPAASIFNGTGSTATYVADPAYPGVMYQLSGASGQQSQARSVAYPVAAKVRAYRFRFTCPAARGNLRYLFVVRRSGGFTFQVQIGNTAAGPTTNVIRVLNSVTAGVLATMTEQLTPGVQYELGILLNAGTTTTDGTWQVDLFPAGSNTPINPTPYSGTGANLNGAAITQHDLGPNDTTTGAMVVQIDDIQTEDGRTTHFASRVILVSGLTAATSDSSLTVGVATSVSGSSPAVTGTALAVAVRAAVAGSSPAVAGSSLTAQLSAAVSGVSAATVGSALAVALRAAVAGSTPAVTDTALTVGQRQAVAGSTAAVVTTTLAVEVVSADAFRVAGRVDAVSGTALTVGLLAAVAGASPAVATSTLVVAGRFAVAARTDSVSDTSLAAMVARPVAGSVDVVATSSLTVAVATPVSGVIAVITETSLILDSEVTLTLAAVAWRPSPLEVAAVDWATPPLQVTAAAWRT